MVGTSSERAEVCAIIKLMDVHLKVCLLDKTRVLSTPLVVSIYLQTAQPEMNISPSVPLVASRPVWLEKSLFPWCMTKVEFVFFFVWTDLFTHLRPPFHLFLSPKLRYTIFNEKWRKENYSQKNLFSIHAWALTKLEMCRTTTNGASKEFASDFRDWAIL